ncbi:MAG: ribonuclease III [Cyanobacteriota bacterium]|nr:ribonuclease III [Cyanobacteriota bacterium]
MDPSRAAELTNLIQRLDAEVPIELELLELVDQALTHVSSGRADHNERLEFLGDAVLRLAATEYLDRHHPKLSVGSSSSLRAQLVSDRWLAELGEHIGLEPLLNLGPKALGDTAARATLRADATEALLGAIYRGTGHLESMHRWLTPHWHRTSAEVQSTPHRFHGKTTLQEWSQGKGLGLPVYVTEQRSSAHGDPQRFSSRVQVGDQVEAEAVGRSRKEAEQNAAAAAVQRLIGSETGGSTEPH